MQMRCKSGVPQPFPSPSPHTAHRPSTADINNMWTVHVFQNATQRSSKPSSAQLQSSDSNYPPHCYRPSRISLPLSHTHTHTHTWVASLLHILLYAVFQLADEVVAQTNEISPFFLLRRSLFGIPEKISPALLTVWSAGERLSGAPRFWRTTACWLFEACSGLHVIALPRTRSRLRPLEGRSFRGGGGVTVASGEQAGWEDGPSPFQHSGSLPRLTGGTSVNSVVSHQTGRFHLRLCLSRCEGSLLHTLTTTTSVSSARSPRGDVAT